MVLIILSKHDHHNCRREVPNQHCPILFHDEHRSTISGLDSILSKDEQIRMNGKVE